MFPPHYIEIYLRTVHHIDFIFHMLIGLGKGLTPIDFFVLYVTMVTFVQKGFRSFR